MINHNVMQNADFYRTQFEEAKLHPHICIDNFFELQYADQLLEHFPPFDHKKAVNEFGEINPKCVHTNIKALGPVYSHLHDYIRSPEFLTSISSLTGIPDLMPDPNLYGGGTHENIDGAELDPHVDFNYDPDTGYHRRLNVLFYLNHEWDESWGGAIEFHSDPGAWRDRKNEIVSYNCVFNRCVIFATSENSWHGFKRIRLPAEKKAAGISRKLISIYLYTKTRPIHEIAPKHGTFYMPYPPQLADEAQFSGSHMLNEHSKINAVALTREEYEELLRLIEKRDNLLKASFNIEKQLSGRIEGYSNYITELSAAIHPTLKGYVAAVTGATKGYFHDKWTTKNFAVTVKTSKKITGAVIYGWLPQNQTLKLSVQVNGNYSKEHTVKSGLFEIEIKKGAFASQSESVAILIHSSRVSGIANSDDERGDLQFILNEIVFSH